MTPNEQAKEQLARLQSWLTSSNALALVSQRIGHDISGYPLDGPIPDFPAHTERGQAFSKTLLEMARREKMTLRDRYNVTAAARGHWVIYGTPSRIADIFEDWFTGGLADGFVIMPAYFPGAFDAFVDRVYSRTAAAWAVPRGVYRHNPALPSWADAVRAAPQRFAAGCIVDREAAGPVGPVGAAVLANASQRSASPSSGRGYGEGQMAWRGGVKELASSVPVRLAIATVWRFAATAHAAAGA